MVKGWGRGFCTSIPKDTKRNKEKDEIGNWNGRKLSLVSKLNFLSSSSTTTTPPPSNPSTPRPEKSVLISKSWNLKFPDLKCRTTSSTPSPLLFSSTRSSPRSPSTALRLCKPSLCGVCFQCVKSGRGTAIFTAECSHSFHFPCLSSLATKNNGVLFCCPLCGCQWKEAPFIGATSKCDAHNSNNNNVADHFRVYDDDEPLMSPVSGIRFNPIPETDEGESEESELDSPFPGFFSQPVTPRSHPKGVEVSISPEAAVVAVGPSYETYAVLLKVNAPPSPAVSPRPAVDLVALIDIGGAMNSAKLYAVKKAMKSVISSLSSNDVYQSSRSPRVRSVSSRYGV